MPIRLSDRLILEHYSNFGKISQMREYERHEAGIPVKILFAGKKFDFIIDNVSLGGMACHGSKDFRVGEEVEIEISLLNPVYASRGKIVWCKEVGDYFELGVEHQGAKDKARLDMVEQISHIEHYRADIMTAEGREISGEQAAREWISKHT